MDKRWTLAIVTVLAILLIYSFLSMVLKSDKKKHGHSRMYRDYSTYGKKSNSPYNDDYSYEKSIYSSAAESRKLSSTLFSNTLSSSSKSYDKFINAVFKNKNENNSNAGNPRYREMIELSRKPVPELQSAIALYRSGDYESAIAKLNEALEKLDPLELKNRVQIYSLLAESYIKLKEDDSYIESKIKQIRIQRKLDKLIKESFPSYEENEFMTTQEASTNLLRIKSSVAKLPDSPMVREMVKKAELDLEVARKVTQ